MTVCLFVVALTTWARGDQIVTESASYIGAKIVSLEDGQLRFRTADGHLHNEWIDNINLLVVDRGGRFADFNQAERFFASGEPQRAIPRYRRALKAEEVFWTDLIAARLLLACDAAGQLEQATRNFLRVLRGRWAGPAAAARLIPRTIPTVRDGKVMRTLDQLDHALRKGPGPQQQVLLELFRYDILRRLGDDRAIRAARKVAALSIPPEARSERVYAIQLEALGESLAENTDSETMTFLDRAIADCPMSNLPSFLLLKGRTLAGSASTRNDRIRAAWAFLRVAIHFADDEKAAEGLYLAATVLERLGRQKKAIDLLEECLGHEPLATKDRRLAESALARLRGVGSNR